MSRLWISGLLFFSLSAYAFDGSDAPKDPPPAPYKTIELKTGLFLAPSFSLDIIEYGGSVVRGGFGLGGQVLAQYFFSPYVGAYAGAGVVGHRMDRTSSYMKPFIEMPIGIAFQYSLAPGVLNLCGLGLYTSVPVSNFEDSTGSIPLKTTFGLDILAGSYFPVVERFELGINGTVRFSFNSPFTNSPLGLTLNALVGITARAHL